VGVEVNAGVVLIEPRRHLVFGFFYSNALRVDDALARRVVFPERLPPVATDRSATVDSCGTTEVLGATRAAQARR
jgi:hypothetical protein